MALEKDGPTDAHRVILEILACETPSSSRSDKFRMNPKSIARSAGYKDASHITMTCRELLEKELVEREDPGYYSISWRGRAYIEGELTLG